MARCNDCGCDMGFFASFGSAICDGCWEKRKQIIKNNLPSNTLDQHPPHHNPQSKTTQGTQGFNIDEGAGIAQGIDPSKLLDTPQSAFDFPEYPGLSVAMRLYIVVGKIAWWLAVLINWGTYILTIILGFVDPEFPLRGVFFGIVLLPLMFLIQLLSNLGLAFVFGSCEIVKVFVRNEENTRTVKKLLEKQLQEETNES